MLILRGCDNSGREHVCVGGGKTYGCLLHENSRSSFCDAYGLELVKIDLRFAKEYRKIKTTASKAQQDTSLQGTGITGPTESVHYMLLSTRQQWRVVIRSALRLESLGAVFLPRGAGRHSLREWLTDPQGSFQQAVALSMEYSQGNSASNLLPLLQPPSEQDSRSGPLIRYRMLSKVVTLSTLSYANPV